MSMVKGSLVNYLTYQDVGLSWSSTDGFLSYRHINLSVGRHFTFQGANLQVGRTGNTNHLAVDLSETLECQRRGNSIELSTWNTSIKQQS